MEGLIHANVRYLQQAATLLDRLDESSFIEPVESFYGSTVGGHLRHCLEHYRSFFDGLRIGRIDYDARARELILETQIEVAQENVAAVCAALNALPEGDLSRERELLVKMDCGEQDLPWQASSIGRELQFLVSHTVHHFAMMGGICQALGLEMEEEFGVAPSTLRYRAGVGVAGRVEGEIHSLI